MAAHTSCVQCTVVCWNVVVVAVVVVVVVIVVFVLLMVLFWWCCFNSFNPCHNLSSNL